MDPQKLQLKIYLSPESARAVDDEALIPVFHRWIKERTLPELLIDVANYLHVPEGPAVALIGHASDYFFDRGEGRLGLLHNRKRCAPPAAERWSDLARRALHAATLLEGEPTLGGRLRFATNELLLRVNDRLAAPNDARTFAALSPELEAFARRLFPGPVDLKRAGGPKDLFAVRITAATSAPLARLLENAGGPPGPDASLVS
jgi:hypothetical protein